MDNNHDIDKKFNEASQSLEEPAIFPGFEKVWARVEEKIDKKEGKKRIVPVWLYSGIAASLIIGLGAFYFLDENDAESQRTQNVIYSEASENKLNDVRDAVGQTGKFNSAEEKTTFKPEKMTSADEKSDLKKEVNSEKISSVVTTVDNEKMSDKPEVADNLVLSEQPISDQTPTNFDRETFHKEMGENKIAGNEKGYFDSQPFNNSGANTLRNESGGLKMNPHERNVLIGGRRNTGSQEDPLVVINGELSDVNVLKIIDPKKIKSIEVLKNQGAAGLYGNKAQNGVIVIQTKKLSRREKKNIRAFQKSLKTGEVTTEKPESNK